MSKHDKTIVKSLHLGRKRVRRESGKVVPRDIVAGIMAILFAFASIGIVFLIMLTNLSTGFGWAAFLFALAAGDAMGTVGTDPAKKELDS